MKKSIIILVAIVVAVAIFWLLKDNKQSEPQNYAIDSYEACVAAGYPVMESYPEQCATPEGQSFTRDISGEVGENGEIIDNGEVGDNDNGEINISLADICAEAGGTWLADFSECEYVDEGWCTANGGIYNECESACRNNPEAEMCTQQCVQVCAFR